MTRRPAGPSATKYVGTGLGLALLMAVSVSAQPSHLPEAYGSETPPQRIESIRGGGGFSHHRLEGFFTANSDADLRSAPGSMGVQRSGIGYAYRDFAFNGAIVRLGANFEFSRYSFSGLDGVSDTDLDASSHRYTAAYIRPMPGSPWSIFSALLVDAGFERGNGYDDAVTWGAIMAAGYKVNEDLSLTMGFFLNQDLEGDVIGFPLLGVNWQATDRLSLGLLPAQQSRELQVLRVASIDFKPDPNGATTYSLVLGFNGNQYRLEEDSDVAPGGIFDETGYALVAGLTHTFDNQLTVSGFLGSYFYRETEILDQDDRTLREDEFDPSGLIGVNLSYAF